jgi:hypothetical protein
VPVNATATVSVPLFGRAARQVRATPGAVPLAADAADAAVQRYAAGSGAWRLTVDRCQ